MRHLILVLVPLPFLLSCTVTKEQVEKLEAKVVQLNDAVKSGGEYAKATLEMAKLIKEQMPALKTQFPALAPFADNLLRIADLILTKGQIVVDTAAKAQIVLGEISSLLAEIKVSIPGGTGPDGKPVTIPWYSFLIGLVGAGIRIAGKVA